MRNEPDESRMDLTNRWSSRLKDRRGLRISSRREPRPLGVVGGAAQLYVMRRSIPYRWLSDGTACFGSGPMVCISKPDVRSD